MLPLPLGQSKMVSTNIIMKTNKLVRNGQSKDVIPQKGEWADKETIFSNGVE